MTTPKRGARAYFIAGVGTDVGKTAVTAGLAAAFCRAGLNTTVMKPVLSGDDGAGATDLDIVERVCATLGMKPEIRRGPYAFRYPASPHLAAAMENRAIEVATIVDAVREARVAGPDVLLVEGAGGLCVPLTERYLMLDLIGDLASPTILVCPVGLGAINLALLSVRALREIGAPIAGIVFNRVPAAPGPIEKDNIETICRLSGCFALASIPILGGPLDDPAVAEKLAGCFDPAVFA